MLVELEALVLKLEATIWLRHARRRRLPLPVWQKAHHAETVMPRWKVLDQLALLRTNGAEHGGPVERFGVANLVELGSGHVQQGIGIAGFELRDEPAIEVELR